MTVPLVEEVARRVPVALMERKEMADLCAWMPLTTVRLRVEKRRTSPLWEGGSDGGRGAGNVEVDREVDGEGTGAGYAR